MASVLYVVNGNAQSVSAGGTVSLGRAVHRNAQSQASLNGDSISIAGNGYFNVDVTITFNGAAGDAEISLYKDGYRVPGAIAMETIATANTEYHTVTISAEILKTPCKTLSSLTVMNLSSIALNVTNVAVRVKRDA